MSIIKHPNDFFYLFIKLISFLLSIAGKYFFQAPRFVSHEAPSENLSLMYWFVTHKPRLLNSRRCWCSN